MLLLAGVSVVVGAFGQVVSEPVTFGSSVKVHSLHEKDKRYLFSENMQWNMQGVQGTQVVTVAKERADNRLYWTVLPPKDAASVISKPVPCGSQVVLTHAHSSRNLFSRRERGILSGQQFVTVQGSLSSVDPGDVFALECVGGNNVWMRDSPVKFRHVQTGKFLKTHARYTFHHGNCPQCAINGDWEVSTGDSSSSEDRWAVSDGVFFNSGVKLETRKEEAADHDEL